MDVVERIGRTCRDLGGERELRVAVLDELRAVVPFDAYAWLLTDPSSCVGWSPVAEVPVPDELAGVIAAKYLTTINRWTGLSEGVAASLLQETQGDRSRSVVWRDWQSRYSIADVASVVLRDRGGCWGFIDLWRRAAAFEPGELALLGEIAVLVTPAIRGRLLATFAYVAEPTVGPLVVLVGDDLRPIAQTTSSDRYLAALLPAEADRGVIPAAVFNVAAQLRAVEAGIDVRPARARVYVPGASWMTMLAGRTMTSESTSGSIAVTIEPTSAADRTQLYGCAAGLTVRETDVLNAAVTGHDTRHIAQFLTISEHTVQDHLKAIFAKTDTTSRRQLVARATGTQQAPRTHR